MQVIPEESRSEMNDTSYSVEQSIVKDPDHDNLRPVNFEKSLLDKSGLGNTSTVSKRSSRSAIVRPSQEQMRKLLEQRRL